MSFDWDAYERREWELTEAVLAAFDDLLSVMGNPFERASVTEDRMEDSNEYTGVPIGGEALPLAEPDKPFDEEIALAEPARVILSPTDTAGKWKNFTAYIGSDPDTDVPPIRIDGWTDPEGVRWVRARAGETPEVMVVFEGQDSYLPPVHLVRYDASAGVRASARKVRRQQNELKKRGL